MEGSANNKWLDEILGEVIGAKKTEPDFGKWQEAHPEAVEMLTSRTGRQYSAGKFAPSKGFRIMKSPIMKLASAAVIVIAAVIGIKGLGGTAAWAAVIEAFNNAGNVHIVKKDISSDGRIVRDIEAWIKNQTCFRAEARDWSIVDDGKNVLTLYKDHKIAHLRESFTPYWDYTPVIMKVFRDSQPENGITVRKVPEECTETVDVYRIDFRNLWQGTAWVDAGSSLPLRITGREKEYEGQTREFEVTFDYEAVADEVFSIAIPADYRELPRLVGSEREEERRQILMGKVVDKGGNPAAAARVFASYAQYGSTDESGNFSLVIAPTDSSGSMGPADFPMFVWAYKDNDPYQMAWTLVRHPEGDRSEEGDAVVEETHQGVKLVINDEEELSASIPGSPGEVFGDSDGGPRVRDIVLVLGPAGVVKGRVTNTTGQPIGGATVQVEEMQVAVGSNKLIVSNLDDEWKAEAYGITDNDGYYSVANLPASWSNIALEASADGYRGQTKQFENDGRNTVDGCVFLLSPDELQVGAATAVEPGGGAMGVYGGYRRAGE